MALYMAALFYSVHYVNGHAAPSTLKTLIALSPTLPCCLAALAILRFYNRMDEMHRRQVLETIAVGAGFMAIVSTALGFGGNAGLPHLGIIWAWPLMGTGWLLAACYRMFRTSISDRGTAKALWKTARIIVPIAALTGLYAWAAPHLGLPHNIGVIALVATAIFLAQQTYYLFFRRPCE